MAHDEQVSRWSVSSGAAFPLRAVERIAQVIADNPRAKFTLVSRSTWSRLNKRSHQHLTLELSERLHGVARVALEARRLWKGEAWAGVAV